MILTAGRQFYEEQLNYLYTGDIENLVNNHYQPDATLIRFDTNVHGHAALKMYFQGYLATLGNLKVLSTDQFVETEDAIFFEATVETTNFGLARVYDAFVLKDGKIIHHFAGVIGPAS